MTCPKMPQTARITVLIIPMKTMGAKHITAVMAGITTTIITITTPEVQND
jgi:hypothetical protein